MTDRTVLVKLKADTGSFQSAMSNAASSMSKVDKAQADAQRRAEKWRAVGVASTVAGGAMAAGLAYAAKAASNQEQAMGALEAVFRTNTAAMKDNANEAVNIGLSQTQYAESAARLGAQLKNLGMDEGQLAGQTDDLITKAADMAAQFGGPTSNAVDAISAALRKERDPIERYGIALTDATIKAEMAASGLDEMGATLSLIEKQMGNSNTLGAAAREFDTTAAATQRARAAFENAAADLGDALLPMVAAVASKAAALAETFSGLPGPVKTAATALGLFAAAAFLIGPRIASTASSIAQLKANLAGAELSGGARGLAGTATRVAAVGAAATIAIPLLTELGTAINGMTVGKAQGDLKLLEAQIVGFALNGSGELGRFAGEAEGSLGNLGVAVQKAGSLWNNGWEMFGNEGQVRRDQINALDAALTNLASTDPGMAAAAFERIGSATAEAGGSVEDLRGAFPQYVAAVDAAAMSTENAATASQRDAAAKRGESDAVKALTNDLQTLIGLNLAQSGSADALIGQTGRLSAAIDANGRSLVGRTSAAAANRDAMRSEVGLIQSLAQATQEKVTASQGEQAGLEASQRVMTKHMSALRDSAVAAGYGRREVDKFFGSLTKIPGAKRVKIDAPGADDSRNKADRVTDSVNKIPRSHSTNVDSPGARQTEGELDDVTGAAKDIPGSRSTNVTESGAGPVADAMRAVQDAISAIDTYIQIETHYLTTGTKGEANVGAERWGGVQRFAEGGRISGPGTGTSDSIGPVMLSDGEYVVRASSVRKYGVGALDRINRGEAPRGFSRGGLAALPKWARRLVKGLPFADDEWLDYNGPRARASMGVGPKWDTTPPKLKQRGNEKKKDFEERKRQALSAYRQERRQTKQAFRDTVARAKLDMLYDDYRKIADDEVARRQKNATDTYEAALKRHEKAAEKAREADQAVVDLQREKAGYIAQVADSLKNSLSASDAYARVKELADAERALGAARAAANTAPPAGREQALKDLADAEDALLAAQGKRTKAEADYSPANVIAGFKAQAAQAQDYSKGLLALKARGLSQSVMDELANMAPDDAMAMVRSLSGMNKAQLDEVNASRASIAQSAKALGNGMGAYFDPAIAAAQAAKFTATVQLNMTPAPVEVKIDGETLAKALIRYQRRTGSYNVSGVRA